MTILALAPAELAGSILLLGVAVAIATRGAWLIPDRPPPPTARRREARSAVTIYPPPTLPARPFDWHQDDPDLSDYAAPFYDVCAGYDVPPEVVGLWPGPPRRP